MRVEGFYTYYFAYQPNSINKTFILLHPHLAVKVLSFWTLIVLISE